MVTASLYAAKVEPRPATGFRCPCVLSGNCRTEVEAQQGQQYAGTDPIAGEAHRSGRCVERIVADWTGSASASSRCAGVGPATCAGWRRGRPGTGPGSACPTPAAKTGLPAFSTTGSGSGGMRANCRRRSRPRQADAADHRPFGGAPRRPDLLQRPADGGRERRLGGGAAVPLRRPVGGGADED